MSSVITVENLSKKYIIGHQKQERYTALRDVMASGAKRFIHKLSHPFAPPEDDPTHEEFWALKDVSFDIQQGDRVGIIGRNGAGKSTLLKILSRITEPTSGRVSIKGRVASLLEVGTGFHPELTGRENIYLNGAILGMSKADIKRKFDEIVAFAEVERFLDTPVKRYSSGMYVRLAFAVAAHLEPEILIVDEVLAVGDAQFQKKCVGKMGDVAKDGKTLLFVSHSMGVIAKLCDSAILLGSGGVLAAGSTHEVIDCYLSHAASESRGGFLVIDSANKDIYFEKIQAVHVDGNPTDIFPHDEPIKFTVYCNIVRWVPGSFLGFYITDHLGRKIFTHNNENWEKIGTRHGSIGMTVTIPKHFLVPGNYFASFVISVPSVEYIDLAQDAISFSVVDVGSVYAAYEEYDHGCVFANCEWAIGDA